MNLLVLGANSDVAYGVAKKFAKYEHAEILLASRDSERLIKKVRDISIRYRVNADALFFDATDYASHHDFYDTLSPKPDGVLVAFGHLGSQEDAQQDFEAARHVIETNFMGAVSILEIIASDFERRGHGFIIGISSVAGERGRQSNYVYGAAKGALTVYLSGLRNRLCKRGVRVITVLPGFIRTKMTEAMDLPEKLMAEPDEAAEDIYEAYKKHKEVVYIKWFWRWIMFLIRLIPEKLFKQLSL